MYMMSLVTILNEDGSPSDYCAALIAGAPGAPLPPPQFGRPVDSRRLDAVGSPVLDAQRRVVGLLHADGPRLFGEAEARVVSEMLRRRGSDA